MKRLIPLAINVAAFAALYVSNLAAYVTIRYWDREVGYPIARAFGAVGWRVVAIVCAAVGFVVAIWIRDALRHRYDREPRPAMRDRRPPA